jgi:HupE / UreJ protein
MLGFDDFIASFSGGASIWLVLAVAVLLGLRHATDPDHLAAVATLVAGAQERAARSAAELGAAWGLGHAATLCAFGVPILLLDRYLPQLLQQGAETVVAFVIAYLALRLIVRSRHGFLPAHPHRTRTRLGAFVIGLVHGMGGSAGVGILLVASIQSQALAVAALALLAMFTAVAMTVLSTGFGAALASRPVHGSLAGAAPAFGLASFGFALWYGAAAWTLAPYPF